MGRRKRRENRSKHRGKALEREDLESIAHEPPPDGDLWHTAEFRRRALIDLAFVALPAVIMVALGEYAIAAAWFVVGLLVVIWQFWGQIRSFWRAMRSGRTDEAGANGRQG
jgi:hypothetical protein